MDVCAVQKLHHTEELSTELESQVADMEHIIRRQKEDVMRVTASEYVDCALSLCSEVHDDCLCLDMCRDDSVGTICALSGKCVEPDMWDKALLLENSRSFCGFTAHCGYIKDWWSIAVVCTVILEVRAVICCPLLLLCSQCILKNCGINE